jgi:hypothetical protein
MLNDIDDIQYIGSCNKSKSVCLVKLFWFTLIISERNIQLIYLVDFHSNWID